MGAGIRSRRSASSPHVVQIHIKDATPSGEAGTWGEEVVVGTGDVDWDAFFGVVGDSLPGIDLMIEREAGESRVEDIKAGRAYVEANFAPGSNHGNRS